MNETNACAVWCVPGCLESTVVVNCMHRGVSYVRDNVPYKKHRYSTCQANDGSVRGSCVLAMGGYDRVFAHVSLHTYVHTRGDWHMVAVGTYPSIGLATAHSLMNKVLSY